MTAKEIRQKFINFFVSRNHLQIPQVSLVPEDDPTLLFVNSGMAPLKDYFLGRKKPPAKRLCNIQRCLRTIDIDKVGANRRTLSFFEMMGTWSIGDYFKEEAIALAWEFLTRKVNLDPNLLWATVFAGSEEIEKDEESISFWQKVGLPKERIVPLPASENLWVSGTTGPFGPCSEVYLDRGEKYGCGKKNCRPGCDCDRFLEIWNPGVFMLYNRKQDGSFEELPIKSVDTGAGLERFALVLQNKDSVFETDILLPIYKAISNLTRVNLSEESTKSLRIITDHTRAAVFLINDGVIPSNKEHGYVLRSLIRRAIRHARKLNIETEVLGRIADVVINENKDFYPELEKNKELIKKELAKEEKVFGKTLSRGLKEFEKTASQLLGLPAQAGKSATRLSGEDVFYLYETYGFPIEITQEMAKEKGLAVDIKGYEKAKREHQEKSRAGAKQKFAGGLADHSEKTAKLHTATHLLHQSLREVLGEHVQQMGSNITAERLRFDFTHDKKLSEDELERISKLVNQKIAEDLPVTMEKMTLEDAKKAGALAFFGEKYGEKVKVYSIGPSSANSGSGRAFSKEACGGPHANRTGELGHFKIIKQESVGKGMRRIKAVVE